MAIIDKIILTFAALNEINKKLKSANNNLIKNQTKLEKQLDKKDKEYYALEKKNEMNLS